MLTKLDQTTFIETGLDSIPTPSQTLGGKMVAPHKLKDHRAKLRLQQQRETTLQYRRKRRAALRLLFQQRSASLLNQRQTWTTTARRRNATTKQQDRKNRPRLKQLIHGACCPALQAKRLKHTIYQAPDRLMPTA
ncbi:Hypothetical predicted protein [Pelobates cultripes]|uniref:Uncharacterized protein n=1 Tax=Pelobates cultripes TaxID=61616 RepID=A0AAD1VVB0_PELCU|nr:Hypothetical predicted protein [Pelobates cultripes]